VNKLLGDEGLRIRLGKQAQDRAESQFNREIMAKKVLDVYREVFS
jgi:glycosyltransferase involved in cell wall biosynthesis